MRTIKTSRSNTPSSCKQGRTKSRMVSFASESTAPTWCAHGIGGWRAGWESGQSASASMFIAGYAVASPLMYAIGCSFCAPMLPFSDVGVEKGLVGVGDCLHTVCLPPGHLAVGLQSGERQEAIRRRAEALGSRTEINASPSR
jgi:hypothetical protein